MLEVQGLCKNFGSLAVTRAVNLSIPQGRRHGIIGPNGAGKTTLFNLLTGELAPDAGTVRVDSVSLDGCSPDARARAGLARSFQRNNLFAEMTVRENLAIACAVRAGVLSVFWRGFSRCKTVLRTAETVAEQLGLSERLATPVRELAYGTQRQLEIGLALALQPKVLLLDEPTAGMSPEETHAMQQLLAALPAELTLVIIEHDMDVLFSIAERVTVLDYGSVLLEDVPAVVRDSAVVRERYLGAAFV